MLESDLSYGRMRGIDDCPAGVVDRLEHYFLSYKQRPDDTARKVSIAEVYDRAEALEMVRRRLADYAHTFGASEARWEELRRLLRG